MAKSLIESLQSIDSRTLLFIPNKIQYSCIPAAKSRLAKIRLVNTAVLASREDLYRIAEKNKPTSIFKKIKEFFI